MASHGIVSSSPYISSPIASVRVFETALPTLSVRDRAGIVLNHHRFWGYASRPSPSGNTLLSSIHGRVARRSDLPRERFSPLTQRRHLASTSLLVAAKLGCMNPSFITARIDSTEGQGDCAQQSRIPW